MGLNCTIAATAAQTTPCRLRNSHAILIIRWYPLTCLTILLLTRRVQQTHWDTGGPIQPADTTPLPHIFAQNARMLVPPGVKLSLLYHRRHFGCALIQSIQYVVTQTLGRCRWARASLYRAIHRRCIARRARRIHARIASIRSLQPDRYLSTSVRCNLVLHTL